MLGISQLPLRRDPSAIKPGMRQIKAAALSAMVEAASVRLRDHVIRTPTIRLGWLDLSDRKVYAKLECHQHTGSFKYRGAFNALSVAARRQSFITASAGNHGLALAAAAERLGRRSTVVVPVNASEIKVNRLRQHADVTLFGRDLLESTRFAMEIAQTSGTIFVSPYMDVDVAAGAGTAAVESFQDSGPFDTVVVPLGGGGLAAGIGSWCRVNSPSTQVVCAHPAVFGRTFDSPRCLTRSLSQPIAPSVADGLAVQLTAEQTPFRDLLQDIVDSVIQVSETEMLQAIGSLLRLESLLTEGAAAAGVAAVSQPGSVIRGRVLILLTGSNISAPDVARSLVTNVPEPWRRRQLGLRNALPSLERAGQVRVRMAQERKEPPQANAPEMSLVWHTLVGRFHQSLQHLETEAERKRKLGLQLGLQEDVGSRAIFDSLLTALKKHGAEFSSVVRGATTAPYWVMEERYRTLLRCLAALNSLLDRTSSAQDQSLRDWFFSVDSHAAMVNYSRYGDSALRSAELRLKAALNLGGDATELLLTSSGMAAYSVLEGHILRHTPPGTRCVLPPYIYFEVLEQLRGLRHFEILHTSSFDVEQLITTAGDSGAGVVSVDPVANNVQLSWADIRHFAESVCPRPGWEERIVIIDGTLISGGMPVFDWFRGPHQPTVLYFESGSKYFQLGLDIQTAGAIVYPSKLDGEMRQLRRNMGLVMYPNDVPLLPPVDSNILQTRLSRLSLNAQRFAARLQSLVEDIAEVNYPHVWQSCGWRHGGALVTVRFRDPGLNNKEGLDACIELILRACRASGTPLVKGASFGFSTGRVSASSTMARDSDPFLRFSVGVDPVEVDRLVEAAAHSLKMYVGTF